MNGREMMFRRIFAASTGVAAAALMFGFMVFANATATRHGSAATEPRMPRAEAIVALTGGAQRIRAAGTLFKEGHAGRLLITGVNRVVSRAKLRRMLNVDEKTFACCVDIDHAAQNTRGNAIETRKWADRHQFQSLIVVTSSYHMPRSMTELGRMLPAVDLKAHPVMLRRFNETPWWLNRENVLLLGSEYLKYLPSAAQYAVGRVLRTPKPRLERQRRHERYQRAIAQKAVAVQ